MVTQSHEKAMFAVTSFNAGASVGLYNPASSGGGLTDMGMNMIDGQVKDDIGKKVKQSKAAERQEAFLDSTLEEYGNKEKMIKNFKEQGVLNQDGKVGLAEMIKFESSSETAMERKSFVTKDKDGKNMAVTATTSMVNGHAEAEVVDIKGGTKTELGNQNIKHQSMNQQMDAFNNSQALKDFVRRTGKDVSFKKDDKGNYLPMSEQSEEAQALFDKFADDNSYNKEVFSNTLSEVATLAGEYGPAIIGTAILNKVAGNPAGKLWESTKTKNSMPKESKNPSNSTQYSQADDTLNKQHDITSLNENLSNIDTNIAKNQEELTKTSQNIKTLELDKTTASHKLEDAQKIFSDLEANPKATQQQLERASHNLDVAQNRVTISESKLADANKHHANLVNNLDEMHHNRTQVVNDINNLEHAKSNNGLKKAGFMAVGEFVVDRSIDYAANNTTGTTQQVAQTAQAVMQSDTVNFAMTGAMLGAAVGTVFAPATATLGGALGGAIGFAKDVYDGDIGRAMEVMKNAVFSPTPPQAMIPTNTQNANHQPNFLSQPQGVGGASTMSIEQMQDIQHKNSTFLQNQQMQSAVDNNLYQTQMLQKALKNIDAGVAEYGRPDPSSINLKKVNAMKIIKYLHQYNS